MQIIMCDKCKKKISSRGIGDDDSNVLCSGKLTIDNYNPIYFELCRDCTNELARFFGMHSWENFVEN